MSKHKSAPLLAAVPAVPSIEQRSGQASEPSDAAADTAPCSREDLIRQGAFALYEARHGEGGSAVDDWLQAERALDQGAALQST